MTRMPTARDWEMSLGDTLHRAATDWPEQEAVVIGPARVSYRTLFEAARHSARYLRHMGVEAGTHVALMGHNSVEWVVGYFAIAMAGAVMIPVNPRFSPREIRYVMRKSRCDLLVAEAGLPALLQERVEAAAGDTPPALRLGSVEYAVGNGTLVPSGQADSHGTLPEVAPTSRAVVMFTSGSSAFPKGCILTHLGIVRNAVLHDARLHLSSADRWFGPTPFFHASGCVWGIMSTTVVGATLVSCTRFDAEEAMDLLERERCTYQHGIDTIFVRQLEIARRRRYDLSRLKKGTTTGPRILLERIRNELGIDYIMSKWGVTEGYGNLSLCDLDDPLERRLGSQGRTYAPFEYRITDPERPDVVLPASEIGEIQVRGASMEGYFDDPAGSAAIMLPDGWLRTGDLGRLDGEYLYYTGRSKDMLKVGGENVAATEIEAVLLRHPAVRNAAVVSRTHGEWGEVPVAFVELVAGAHAEERELIDHCRLHLAAIKVPRQVVQRTELPRTGSGKVDKKLLIAG